MNSRCWLVVLIVLAPFLFAQEVPDKNGTDPPAVSTMVPDWNVGDWWIVLAYSKLPGQFDPWMFYSAVVFEVDEKVEVDETPCYKVRITRRLGQHGEWQIEAYYRQSDLLLHSYRNVPDGSNQNAGHFKRNSELKYSVRGRVLDGVGYAPPKIKGHDLEQLLAMELEYGKVRQTVKQNRAHEDVANIKIYEGNWDKRNGLQPPTVQIMWTQGKVWYSGFLSNSRKKAAALLVSSRSAEKPLEDYILELERDLETKGRIREYEEIFALMKLR